MRADRLPEDGRPLAPGVARAYLRELSADVRESVILAADGALLAGPEALADLAREFVGGMEDDIVALEVMPRARGDTVLAARSERFAVVVVCGRFLLPAVVREDLRTVLAELAGERPGPAPPAPLRPRPIVPVARGLGWLRPEAAPIVRLYAEDGELRAPMTSEPGATMLVAVAVKLSERVKSTV